MQIKRITKDESAFLLRAYAFGSSPVSAEELQRHRDSTATDDDTTTLAAYDRIGGAEPGVAAVVGGTGFRQNIRGLVVPMLGVGGVASHPAARRRGHVRALMNRLHADLRDQGCVTAALYPFRPTFYERFGYVGLPKARSVRLLPQGIQRRELPGTVTFHRIDDKDAAATGLEFLHRMLAERHGFALAADRRHTSGDDHWVVFARDESGAVIGMLHYRTKGLGQDLIGRELLSTGPLGQALILQWLVAHADQFSGFCFELPPDERPDLWDTDVQYEDRTSIRMPTQSAPMGRVLSMPGLSGLTAGAGERVTVEVVDDPFVGGTWTFDSTDGAGMQVRAAAPSDGEPAATLTSHGLAGLVYGSLDPRQATVRGFGTFSAEAARALAALFPRSDPYLYVAF